MYKSAGLKDGVDSKRVFYSNIEQEVPFK